MKRLFFGLAVDPEVGERIVRSVRSSLGDGTAFTVYDAADLHVTLCFLGAVEEDRVPVVERAANHEFRALHAPELSVGGSADAFPSRSRPRVLFSCVSEGVETAGRLAALRNRAVQVGLSTGWRPPPAERDRPFRAHVTVARPRSGARVPEDFWDLGSERRWTPVDIVLFESVAGREAGGERYRVLASWPLAVGPG